MPITVKQSFFLSKKKFFRAPQWELKLAARIFIGFLILYFLVAFLALGVGLFFIIRKFFPDQEPVSVVNQWMLYFFAVDFLFRYFFQNPPVTDVKSFLLQPITKSQIVRRVMFRSLTSFFNFIPLIVLLPFCVVLSIENGLTLNSWIWFLGILTLSGVSNFLIFLINKNRNVALGMFVFVVGGCLSETFLGLPIISYVGSAFNTLYS